MLQDVPKASGIYKITCIATGKIYIGSAVNLRKRRTDHFYTLGLNQHKNPKMQAAFNKYGADTFTFEVLEYVLPISLTAREQYWFNKLKPFDKRGFNIAPIAGSHYGMKRKSETGRRISDAKKGKPSTRIGWHPTQEDKERRKSTQGFKHSEQARQNMANAHIGLHRSQATKDKMRLSALGHAPTNAKTFILTSPDGVEYVVIGLPKFCMEHSLHASTLYEVAKGKRKQHKGWKARYSV